MQQEGTDSGVSVGGHVVVGSTDDGRVAGTRSATLEQGGEAGALALASDRIAQPMMPPLLATRGEEGGEGGGKDGKEGEEGDQYEGGWDGRSVRQQIWRDHLVKPATDSTNEDDARGNAPLKNNDQSEEGEGIKQS